MKSNTQNKKIEAITESTLVIGIDVGSETHYARVFDWRGYEYSKKPFVEIVNSSWHIFYKDFVTYAAASNAA